MVEQVEDGLMMGHGIAGDDAVSWTGTAHLAKLVGHFVHGDRHARQLGRVQHILQHREPLTVELVFLLIGNGYSHFTLKNVTDDLYADFVAALGVLVRFEHDHAVGAEHGGEDVRALGAVVGARVELAVGPVHSGAQVLAAIAVVEHRLNKAHYR